MFGRTYTDKEFFELITNNPWHKEIRDVARKLADHIDAMILYEYITGRQLPWDTPTEEINKLIEEWDGQ